MGHSYPLKIYIHQENKTMVNQMEMALFVSYQSHLGHHFHMESPSANANYRQLLGSLRVTIADDGTAATSRLPENSGLQADYQVMIQYRSGTYQQEDTEIDDQDSDSDEEEDNI